jgi:hypothetical protein
MALLQVQVRLRERAMLVQQGLAIHGPLQLGVLQFVDVTLPGVQMLLGGGQLFFFLGQLRGDVVLQRLEMRDEILVLLQDVREGLGFWRFRTQAAFRPCCR